MIPGAILIFILAVVVLGSLFGLGFWVISKVNDVAEDTTDKVLSERLNVIAEANGLAEKAAERAELKLRIIRLERHLNLPNQPGGTF